ncbi:hypothetical protein BDR26DRAFT_873776 [Obelidium mucronatum]|nr:hypothetical protein BDR26DRAFT_873776 [Obelidium mucronatum]
MGPLLKQLERFNPSEVHYLGLPFGVPKGACGETNPPKFGHSGTGIYLSKAAMKVLGKVGDGCVLKYQDCWGGDVTLSLCLRDAGVKLSEPKSNLNGLYGDPPLGDFNYDMDACNEPSAFCHLTKEQIQMFQSLRQQPERVTMGDIYQKFKGGFNLTDFVQPNVDISGTFYHHNKNQNYIDCQKQCINDPKCVAWVGEANKVCWLKKAPGKVKSRNGWAGGHIGNRYRCEEKEKGKKA